MMMFSGFFPEAQSIADRLSWENGIGIADRLSWENGIGAPTVPCGGFILQWAEASEAQRETGCLSPSSTLLSADEENVTHVYLI